MHSHLYIKKNGTARARANGASASLKHPAITKKGVTPRAGSRDAHFGFRYGVLVGSRLQSKNHMRVTAASGLRLAAADGKKAWPCHAQKRKILRKNV